MENWDNLIVEIDKNLNKLETEQDILTRLRAVIVEMAGFRVSEGVMPKTPPRIFNIMSRSGGNGHKVTLWPDYGASCDCPAGSRGVQCWAINGLTLAAASKLGVENLPMSATFTDDRGFVRHYTEVR